MRAVSLLSKSAKKQQSLCLFIRMLQLRTTIDLHEVLIVEILRRLYANNGKPSLLQEGKKRNIRQSNSLFVVTFLAYLRLATLMSSANS